MALTDHGWGTGSGVSKLATCSCKQLFQPSNVLRLQPGVKTIKQAKLGETDSRCLSWITTQSSALIERKKRIRRANGVGGILLVNG